MLNEKKNMRSQGNNFQTNIFDLVYLFRYHDYIYFAQILTVQMVQLF